MEKAKGFLKRDEPRPRETVSSGDFREEEIFIPHRREIADVSKQARVREEVRVNKRMETEQSQISETLRKEDVDLDRDNRTDRSDPTDRTDRTDWDTP